MKTRRDHTRDEATQRLGEAFATLDVLNLLPTSTQDVPVEIVTSEALPAPVGRDPDDDHVLACALATKAELIV